MLELVHFCHLCEKQDCVERLCCATVHIPIPPSTRPQKINAVRDSPGYLKGLHWVIGCNGICDDQ